MHALPLVSIVTPSYNQSAFLEQTICSVLAQDYQNLEYLIVDGGSTDGSLEIIQRHADRLAWWVSEKDSGQAEAINKGLQRARGEIVAWLNSDDLYLPGAVSQAVAALQQDPELAFIYGEAITINQDGRPLGRFRFENWGLHDLVSFRIICQPAVFMRRTFLERAGYLDPGFHFMLDHHLWIRLARLAPIAHQPADLEPPSRPVRGLWAAARHHPGAKNVSQAAGFGRETFKVLEWMQTSTDLSEWIRQNRSRVLAGAYRLNARYLLDDGLAWEALASYWQALRRRPAFALKHAHRMLYAVLSLLGLKSLIDRLAARLNRRKRRKLARLLRLTTISASDAPQADEIRRKAEPYHLVDWPGIDLND